MRPLNKVLAGILLAFLLPSPAEADWQFTRWGMSLAEVLNIEGRNIAYATNKQKTDLAISGMGEALAVSSVKAADVQLQAVYLFKAGKLNAVSLITNNHDDASHLLSQMSQVYGAPLEESNKVIGTNCRRFFRIWLDRPRNNGVTLYVRLCSKGEFGTELSSDATIIYSYIAPKANSGL